MHHSKFSQALCCFAILVISYFAYARTVVPWIEPEAVVIRSRSAAQTEGQPAPTEKYQALLKPLFRPDSWERGTDVMFGKANDFLLLFRQHDTLETGELLLAPCTLVYLPPEEGQRTWIVQAAEGAELKFDAPFNSQGGRIGNLQEGFLRGRVIISGSSLNAAQDDRVEIDTRGVQLSREAIATPHDVHFRYGPHFGSGRDLTIRLRTPRAADIQRLPTTAPTQIQQIELVSLDEAVIFVPAEGGQPPRASPTPAPHRPVKVTCDGPLVLNVESGFARVSRNVRIACSRTGRPPDELHCEQITAHLATLPPTLTAGDDSLAKKPAIPKMRLDRIVAMGRPATFRSITGEGSEQRWLRLDSAKFEYVYESPATIGQFEASGVGSFATGLLTSSAAQLELSWKDNMEFQPQSDQLHLALVGDATCHFEEFGQIRSETIWVQMKPTAAESVAAKTASPD